MRFDDRFITELKARNDISDVIGQYVVLRKAGSRLNGLCPFHSEKTPSFTVFPDTSSYYCFGCGAGGDVITFIMNTEHLDYVDAVQFLAQRAHIPLPEDDADYHKTARARERQLEMHKIAARHFYENLRRPEGAAGAAYYEKRGLAKNTVTRFGLGMAIDSFDDLRGVLRKNGFRDEEAYDAGLLIKSQKNGKYYDKFRNRVMFPVIDVRGNVVAFSGRVLDDSKPKYMNSPETLLYKKSQTVFGLNFAKNNEDGVIILVEGNIDVVTLHQAGFKNAVAPLGTAFTKEQARMLAKYAKSVLIAFDMDAAGRKAAEKAIGYLEEVGVTVRVPEFTGAKDPDEFIRKYGKDRFAMILTGSKNPTQFALDKLKTQYDLTGITGKTEYIRAAVKVLAEVSSDIERELFCGILAKQTELSPETVRLDVDRARKRYVSRARADLLRRESPTENRRYDPVNPDRSSHLRASKAEEGLIALLSRHPDLADAAAKEAPPEIFVTGFNRKAYEFYLTRLQNGEPTDGVLSAHFDPAQAAWIFRIINTDVPGDDPLRQIKDFANVLREEREKQIDPGSMSADDLQKLIMKRRNKDGNGDRKEDFE